MCDGIRAIHRENFDRRPPDSGPADEDGPLPSEVPFPLVSSRMEEPRDLARHRIDSGKILTFVSITIKARDCHIRGDRLAAMGARHDVFVLKGNRGRPLAKPTVFARTLRALPDQRLQGRVHALRHRKQDASETAEPSSASNRAGDPHGSSRRSPTAHSTRGNPLAP